MANSNGPVGPGGYTVMGGPPQMTGGPWGPPPGGPPMTGGPWGPAPGGYPPPPPQKKSHTGLIIGIIIAVVVVIPMCAGIVIIGRGAFVARSVGTIEQLPYDPPPQPADASLNDPQLQPVQPLQPANRLDAPAATLPGSRAVRGAGYSYNVPTAWEELDASTLGSALITHAQRSPFPTGNFATNVNVAGEAFSGDGPAYGAANLVELQKVSTVRGQRATVNGSRPSWSIEAYWPNSNGPPYVTLQRYVTNGFKGYVITCSTGASAFAQQKPICESVLSSFRVD